MFFKDLSEKFYLKTSYEFTSSEEQFTNILSKHAPIKKKIIRGNNKPFMKKTLRKAISTRSKLRRIANKTGDPVDILRYKKHRNSVKCLNDKTKKDYFKNLDPKHVDTNRKFWKTFKLFFSSKYTPAEKMIIMDKGAVLSDDLEIAECMNTYFVNISITMDIKKWPEQCPCIDTDDIIAKAIHKYENHPSITKYNIGES